MQVAGISSASGQQRMSGMQNTEGGTPETLLSLIITGKERGHRSHYRLDVPVGYVWILVHVKCRKMGMVSGTIRCMITFLNNPLLSREMMRSLELL